MSIIGVECNADRYFFGQLLKDKGQIRKEKNDGEVIKGIIERSGDSFRIGIVDVDKRNKIPPDFNEIYTDDFTKIFKHRAKCHFLILIGPRQFEHWINSFLTLNGQNIQDFDFNNVDEFMKKSKTLKPELEPRFKNVMDFVFENLDQRQNHILKLKMQLRYLLERKYQFSIEEFQNI